MRFELRSLMIRPMSLVHTTTEQMIRQLTPLGALQETRLKSLCWCPTEKQQPYKDQGHQRITLHTPDLIASQTKTAQFTVSSGIMTSPLPVPICSEGFQHFSSKTLGRPAWRGSLGSKASIVSSSEEELSAIADVSSMEGLPR